ncbi:MAG: hypothetical protein ACKON8_10295 [Planctomycetota bacterium]
MLDLDLAAARLTRRTLFGSAGQGIGMAALAALLGRDARSEPPPRGVPGLPGLPHHAPRAKRVRRAAARSRSGIVVTPG